MHLREIKEIVKAWLAVSVMFAIAFSGGLNLSTLVGLPIFLVTAGLGFVLHELSHKYVAQKLKCWAEFRASNRMLIIGIIVSFFGFVFAAPGGVYIRGGPKHSGKIAAAGPLMNVILALIFIPIFFYTTGILQTLCGYGWLINAWLAAFNMIPVPPFDGQKIVKWNKLAYFSLLAAAMVVTVTAFSYVMV
jgi:Zn-dependent protease